MSFGKNASGTIKVSDEKAKEIARSMYRYDKITQEHVNSLEDVGREEVARYKDQGYVIVENALTRFEIDAALSEINDIIEGRLSGPKLQIVKPKNKLRTPEEREFAIRKIYNYVEFTTALRQIAFHGGILAVVAKLLGDQPQLINEQALLKPPFGGAEKPWHQDMAYGGLFYNKQIVSVWISLDHADLDNGCMHLIPRSHLRGGTLKPFRPTCLWEEKRLGKVDSNKYMPEKK